MYLLPSNTIWFHVHNMIHCQHVWYLHLVLYTLFS